MYVCLCHAVTEDEVRDEIAAGARTPGEVADRCDAGNGCGSCVDRICGLISATRGEHDRIPVVV